MHERFRLLPSFPLILPFPPKVLSEVLSRVRQPEIYMCVCPALKRYPRFTGTRDPDPVRLLKKLRDRKGLLTLERNYSTRCWRMSLSRFSWRDNIFAFAVLFLYICDCLVFLLL